MERQAKRVRLYALSTCPVCKRLRQFLDKSAIAYEYIEVDLLESGEQWVVSKEVKKYNPSGSYPTVVVEEVIKGFDEEGLKEALGIK
ncbi:MAG: glutaredoxin family protein [Nitrospirae bacterium]|nr:glutaredoxin family protein [Nitrospirota bacterium]